MELFKKKNGWNSLMSHFNFSLGLNYFQTNGKTGKWESGQVRWKEGEGDGRRHPVGSPLS